MWEQPELHTMQHSTFELSIWTNNAASSCTPGLSAAVLPRSLTTRMHAAIKQADSNCNTYSMLHEPRMKTSAR